jgi:DtxR family Mn-dependent transcriptional regulator
MHKLAPAHETKLSRAIEDYVKAIHLLHQEHAQVTTSLLAEHLGVTPPSVTGMIQKLAKLHLVTYTLYRGVVLTDIGQHSALEVLRHHRLIELFLVQALGYTWAEAHVEVEVLGHAVSARLAARMQIYLTRDLIAEMASGFFCRTHI